MKLQQSDQPNQQSNGEVRDTKIDFEEPQRIAGALFFIISRCLNVTESLHLRYEMWRFIITLM
jgi:hypothetical protein